MPRTLFIAFLILSAGTFSWAQPPLPTVSNGTIERIENVASQYMGISNIDVWLPEGYSGSTKYAALYMHDGQMLFDAGNAWNKQSWDIDDVAIELMRANKVEPFIIVGILNGGQVRHADYFPQKPYETLSQVERDSISAQLQRLSRTTETFNPRSDNYLKFIVQELKPLIDSRYSVYTDKEHTFMAGSSMGGLISMYAICEYPEVFGGVACISTHWPGTFTLENNPIPEALLNYLSKHLPDPKSHRIYFDCGDQTLDAMYPAIQKRVDSVMVVNGFTDSNWVTKYFPGDDHSEKSWHGRLHIPLTFLLRPSSVK